ncbi:cytochrome c [Pseudolysobacter antarcticus]|uniref:Cytochrome c n=1 Tax=Pseudolysobacter antarcticus TaxID=2511995 RepID=A0A411HL11_9GAMM|nr:cytochrome c [Pseudolysobacter antarcticus]
MHVAAHIPLRAWIQLFIIFVVLALSSACCFGEESSPFSAPGTLAERGHFKQQDGEALYRAICQGCHMPDASGAHGAGMYPALAANPKLASVMYPAITVLAGRRGMPQFHDSLSDQQVAAVVNYLRSHFGNDYADKLMSDDVAQLRASLLSAGGSR